MSLLDALLLDPHPFNVWIARRADGVKGSRTASDPYDGNNIVRLDSANPVQHVNSNVQTLNNLTPGGALIESVVRGVYPLQKAPEIVTKVHTDLDEVVLLSIL
jgi:hypothetical protein